MTLDRFEVFTAVATHRNVTLASAELHLSQPAVTKQLKALEKDYNVKLYKRGGRGVELTETGEAFLKDVRKILGQYVKLRQKFSAASNPIEPETLTVGGSLSLAESLLPSLLAAFSKMRPNVQINLRAGNGAVIERHVLTSEVDIAVVINAHNAASNHLLCVEPYRREPVVAFVSARHPLNRKKKVSWRDLQNTPFITRTPAIRGSFTERLLRSLGDKGIKPNVVMRCDSPESVKTAVERKMGVGILLRKTIEPEMRRGEIKTIKLPVEIPSAGSMLVYRKDIPLSPAAQAFLDFLRRQQRNPSGGAKYPH